MNKLFAVLAILPLLLVPAQATPGADDACFTTHNYLYATDVGKLQELIDQVNALPGTRLRENNRYLIQEILSVAVVDLGDGHYQLVVLLELLDTCTRGE